MNKQNDHRLRNTAVCVLVLLAVLATGAVAGGENGVVKDLIYPIFGGAGSIQLSNVGPSAVGFVAKSNQESQEMSQALEQAQQDGWTLRELTRVEGPSARGYAGPPEVEEGAVLYYGRQHLQEHYNGAGDYNAGFSCEPADGNRLDVWVANTGETPLYFNVEWTTLFGVIVEKYEAIPLDPGEQYTWMFSYDNDAGIDGDWNVNVTTRRGGGIDIDASARQYQGNP